MRETRAEHRVIHHDWLVTLLTRPLARFALLHFLSRVELAGPMMVAGIGSMPLMSVVVVVVVVAVADIAGFASGFATTKLEF